jgi:hypothetical protein
MTTVAWLSDRYLIRHSAHFILVDSFDPSSQVPLAYPCRCPCPYLLTEDKLGVYGSSVRCRQVYEQRQQIHRI